MVESPDLEYCVRDQTGRIVVPWRPVGDVLRAAEEFGGASMDIELQLGSDDANKAAEDAYFASHLRLEQLLGLEPAPEADRAEDQ